MKIDLKQIDRFITEISKRFVLERVVVEDLKLDGQPITQDTYFGAYSATYDVNGLVEIPNTWDHFILEVHADREGSDSAINPQFKLFVKDALVGTYDINHPWIRFDKTDESLAFHLNIYTGNNAKKFPIKVSILRYSQSILGYVYDLKVIRDALKVLTHDQIQFYKIYDSVIESMKCIDVDADDEAFEAMVLNARSIIETMYDDNESYKPTIFAVGHTHIDVAWLWTVSQAVEKAERSFTTILNYMDEYPEFKFIQSQPQLYDFIEKKNPDLFKRIVKAIEKGNWEPEGSMWVESDTTLVSGESLVRQLLYGKQYFKSKFGVDNKILWLPDVFGYSAALPQLLKQAHIPYFMTTKLSWNQFNQIPYDTFNWVGIDGSEVLTHFIPTPGTEYKPRPWYTTYNGFLDVESVAGGWHRYQQKNLNTEVLNAFGFGDGGGGPTELMLETGRRLVKGVPGIPNVKFTTALEFFETLNANVKHKAVPSWHGELYFEFHRGTYTARADNKKMNRKLEYGLQNIEKLGILTQTPQDSEHKTIWKRLLLNQFHDILPGSSIKEVYEDSTKDYAWIASELERIKISMLDKGDYHYAFNPTGIPHTSITRNNKPHVPLDASVQYDAYGNQTLLFNVDETLLKSVDVVSVEAKHFKAQEAPKTLDTPFYNIVFNDAYEITSLIDKTENKEIVLEGMSLNALRLYEDLPSEYDAWDVDEYHTYKSWRIDEVVSASLISDGDIETVIEIKRDFSKSSLTQTLHFYKAIRRIDVITSIDWYENGKILKAEFDVDVNAKDAVFDIQYGTITRTNHTNTSWDVAQFEVNAQKWADISDRSYGFSILNDSKYGYSAKENHLSLSLLRGSSDPYEKADHGHHEFTYSLFPHAGGWFEAGVMDEANVLNNPVAVYTDVKEIKHILNPRIQSDSVYVDTLKESETDDKTIVIRLYEYANKPQDITFTLDGMTQVIKSNILEEDVEVLEVKDQSVTLHIKAYEVVSLKVKVQ